MRETLLELAESRWEFVPGLVQRQLRQWACGWGNTHISECIFQVLKDKQRRIDTSGKLSKRKCWSYAHQSGLFQEFGRAEG